MKELSIDKRYQIFKELATQPLYEVGIKHGFDKYYKDSKAVKSAVYRVYADVKNNPEKYGVGKEAYELVVESMSSRAVAKRHAPISMKESMDIEKMDIKEVILDNRNKAAKLISMKLDMIGKSKKQLENLSITALTTTLGILFDKGQIIQGEATEHIAHLSKIEDGLSPQQLLDAVVNQRQHTVTVKNK